MVTAIVGANWGDEGKGKITDVKAAESDIVVRFQGGSNAGHTIINNYGKFALHQLPSGVFYEHITNIIGNGVALSVENFIKELNSLEGGYAIPCGAGLFGGGASFVQILWFHKIRYCTVLFR